MIILRLLQQDQYKFVYNAVLEAITLGETTIPCYQFEKKYKELLQVNEKTKTTQLEEQFKVINCSRWMTCSSCVATLFFQIFVCGRVLDFLQIFVCGSVLDFLQCSYHRVEVNEKYTFCIQILELMKDPLREEDLSFAKEEENSSKNRDPGIIPRKSLV